MTDTSSCDWCNTYSSNEKLPTPGVTVVSILQQLREATGPIWIACMSLLLQEIEQAERLGEAKQELGESGNSSSPEF